MIINNYVSIDRVIENVFRDAGYDNEINWIDAIEWVGEVIDLIGVRIQYLEKVTNGTCPAPCQNPSPIIIENYRGELPCDLASIIQIRRTDNKVTLQYSTDNFHQYNDLGNGTNNSTLTTGINGRNRPSDFSYKIQNNIIMTSFKDGELELSYLAFPTDEKGFPLIPNDTKVIKAVSTYLIERIDYKLWRQNKISGEIYQNSHREYCWAVARATSHLSMPSLDEMESIKNMWVRLIPNLFNHRDGFKYLGNDERRYNKNSI